VLAPATLVPVVATWLVAVMLWGFVGLATMLAALALPVAVVALCDPVPSQILAFALVMAAFVVYTHRTNIARMLAGTENRVKHLWLLRPRDAGR